MTTEINGKPLYMPEARTFADILEYVGEWKDAQDTEPRYIPEQTPSASAWEREAWTRHADGRNRVGPYCTIDTRKAGGKSHRGVAVRATDAAIAAIAPVIVTPDDTLSFQAIAWDKEQTLVLAQHGYISGSIWLAVVPTSSLPSEYIDPARVHSSSQFNVTGVDAR